jgi:GTPase SAR1 family protein
MSDIDAINELEKILQVNLGNFDQSERNQNCYILDQNGRVTDLYLDGVLNDNLGQIVLSLQAFRKLTGLHLKHNKIRDISPLMGFRNLVELELAFNQIEDISPLTTLPSLLRIDLGGNKINDISVIEKLPNLIELDLPRNQIGDISSLKGLKSLESLNLLSNPITDIDPLSGLSKLFRLRLDEIQADNHSSITRLTNLRALYFSSSNLFDIHWLALLQKLEVLWLFDNNISSIEPLRELTNLHQLSLQRNQVRDLSPLRNLKKLQTLYLAENPIEVLPSWLLDLGPDFRWTDAGERGYINFGNNPLKTPPPEIVKEGKNAIRNYFKQLREQDQDYSFEAKMLIVGEPGAGKTSLARKLEDPDCDLPGEDETTKGIEIKQYYFPLQIDDFSSFPHPEKLRGRSFRLNLWDFGGQQIYKATHRFFLSKRTLYALVADNRKEDTDYNYWLHIIEMFGADSPVLIILNEKFQRKPGLDIAEMRKQFPSIAEAIEIDFAENDRTRLHNLQKAIRYYVSKLPHIGSPIPAKWTDVREKLEKDERNTIAFHEYLKICYDNGITKAQDASVLSQYFHDIGVFLHFQDDPILRHTIFLKPNWATNTVYRILDHELLNQTKGRFNRNDTRTIWKEDEFDLVRDELLRLMQKFFLAYEIGTSGDYIVPERLPSDPPNYHLNKENSLVLRYEYDAFMPKGIISQFIVQMSRYIQNHNYVWRRGFVIERDGATAEVIEDYHGRNMTIRVTGKDRRDFMTIITEELDQVNAQYKKITVEKLIPCNCSECETESIPHFFRYKDLKRRLEKGRQEVECERSYELMNINKLINNVIDEKKSSEKSSTKRRKVFVSYAHEDREWLERVQTHLKALDRLGIDVELWDDTQIQAGMPWRDEIEKGLSATKVAILLVSTDFLASDFITNNELPSLLKAAKNEGTVILPLIVKPCMYTDHENLAEIQSVNNPLNPLSALTENGQEEVLVKLAKRIAEILSSQT